MRFRHLHMHPRRLDDDAVFSGRVVKEGERLGTIGNYNRRPGMTTTHLHFEIQVPTRDGFVRVNPYMTLVAAYEHLIGARGSEVSSPAPAEPAEMPAAEASASGSEAPLKSAAVVAASAVVKVAAVEDSPRLKKHGGKAKNAGKSAGKTKGKAKAASRAKAKARFAKASGRKRR
jgi:hypothetical protein